MAVNKTVLTRAQSAMLARDFELATRLYKELLHENPNDTELLRQLGNLHVKSGKDDLALPVFEKIVSLESDDVDALISIGGIYRRQKKYDESIAVLERALATGTNSTQVSYNLGFTFRQMGRYDDAIACFEDVVDQNPNDVLAFNHIGAIYAERDEHEEAINTYQRGLKIDPNHPILQMNMAKSYEALGQNKQAIASYAAALKSKPGWLEAIDNYSNLLLKLNRVRDAYELVNGALRLNADDVKMHTRMGDVYLKQSIYHDAEKEYKEALSYDEEYIPALEGLVDSQESQGKTAEAVKTIQKIEKISPNNATVIQKSASVYLSANYLPAAYEKIMQLVDSSTADVRTISLLGQYYICNGEWDKAEDCLRQIVALDPTFSEFYRDGAKRFVQTGKTEEAEKYLHKAVETNPYDAKALTDLGTLYEKTNRLDKAYDFYKKAATVDENNHVSKQGLMRMRQANPTLALYDAPPSFELQNAEVHDGIPVTQQKPNPAVRPDFSDLLGKEPPTEEPEETPAEPTVLPEPLTEDSAEDAPSVDSLVEELVEPEEEPLALADDVPDDSNVHVADDTPADDTQFSFPEDTSFNFDEFDAPEDRDNEMISDDDEEETDVPSALSETLDKINAAADKASLAASEAWRAAKKAADYAQAAEDASRNAPISAESAEQAPETTEGDSEVTDDDLDELVDVPILDLPDDEGETEVTDDDISDIRVPILSPGDSVNIPGVVTQSDPDIVPKELSSPSILDMVEATDDLAQFKESAALFQTLRAMAENLPEAKRIAFKQSAMCEKLDEIIARLVG